jgi:hypothetical protein
MGRISVAFDIFRFKVSVPGDLEIKCCIFLQNCHSTVPIWIVEAKKCCDSEKVGQLRRSDSRSLLSQIQKLFLLLNNLAHKISTNFKSLEWKALVLQHLVVEKKCLRNKSCSSNCEKL